jgi:two-component system OmpR family response regulator
MKEIKTVFIVDDDKNQATMVADHLGKFKHLTIKTFSSGEECLENLTLNPQIIFLDYNFDKAGAGAMNGIKILDKIKEKNPNIEVVMFSGQEKIEIAVNTMKHGAFDYIIKNESSFHRSENVIKNIIRKLKLESNVKLFKRLFIGFACAFVAMLIGIIVLYAKGMIREDIGWF